MDASSLQLYIQLPAKPFERVLRDLWYVTTMPSNALWVDLTDDDIKQVREILRTARDRYAEDAREAAWFYLMQAQMLVAYRDGRSEKEFKCSDEMAIKRFTATIGAVGGKAPRTKLQAIRKQITEKILAAHRKAPFKYTTEMRNALFALDEGDGCDENWFRRTLKACPELGELYGTLKKKRQSPRTRASR